MNKVTRLKYYIESLCIYDFEDDDVFRLFMICFVMTRRIR